MIAKKHGQLVADDRRTVRVLPTPAPLPTETDLALYKERNLRGRKLWLSTTLHKV